MVCLRDIPHKTFLNLIEEMNPQTKSLKEGKDEKFKKETGQFQFLPSLYDFLTQHCRVFH